MIMKLNKRYLRGIKHDLSFYVSSTALTVMTLVLFFVMNIAGDAILRFGDDFFAAQKVEDAQFTTYLPMSAEEEAALEEKYALTLEPQYFANIETGDITTRLFKKTQEINLHRITEGRDVETDDEVIISEGYAVENKVAVGDRITIGEKAYTVTGFFQRPDYLYMVENVDDAYKNVTTFFLACVTDAEFERIGSTDCIYQVRYTKDNQMDFRREVNARYQMRSYLSADDNIRIYIVKMQAEMYIYVSYIILAVMPLLVVILVSIVINRKVKSEQKQIGTLTALGYKKGQLMRHYAGFAVIPGLLGGILSVVLAMVFAQPFGELGLADYEPMRIQCKLSILVALLGILVPTIMYVLASMVSVHRLLKKDPVLLLSANDNQNEKNYKHMLKKKKLSFRIKYALRSLIGNPARTFVVFLGIFLGSFITLLGFSLLDTMENTKQNLKDEMGSYEYQYVLNELSAENTYGGEPLLMSTMETVDGDRFSIIGTRDANPYLELKDLDGKSVSLEDGYYVTGVMALLYDLETGDSLTICNPLSLEETSITIAGIIDNDMQSAVFGSRENIARMLGMDENVSNVIMSDKELDIPASKVIQVLKQSDAKEQFQNMSNQMDVMIYMVIGMGAAICIAAIYVAVNMLVTENRSNISMLKVLGYKDRQINRIVLNVNHVLLPVGFLLSIPLVFASTKWFMRFLAEFIGSMPKAYIAPESFVYTGILISASYFGSLFLLRRKVAKVNMVESLKGNRE
jgi:putative ABC transport system permease protein